MRLRNKHTQCPACKMCKQRGDYWGGENSKNGIFACYQQNCPNLYAYWGEQMSVLSLPFDFCFYSFISELGCKTVSELRTELPTLCVADRITCLKAFESMGIPTTLRKEYTK